MTPENEEPNYYDMSDDEISNMTSPPAAPAASAEPDPVDDNAGSAPVVEEQEEEDQGETVTVGGNEDGDEGETEADKAIRENAAEAAAALSSPDGGEKGAGDPKPGAPSGEAAKGDAKGAGEPATQEEPKLDADGNPIVAPPADEKGEEKGDVKPVTEADKVSGFDRIMAPFKANGKEIKLNSPEEAIKLMQMGANYTKKMQALQPSMQILHMLRNNDLLDAGKLSYLIDLHNKNPDAIQKLVADSGINAMDLDADKGKQYVPGNHQVSAEEFALQTVMEDVATSPTGHATLEIVTRQWDADSKKVLFNEPELLKIIDDQRQSGVYDRINDEIDRRKMLGEFQNVPFLHAYKAVGDVLYAAPAQRTPPTPDPVVVTPPAAVPLATKVLTPPKAPNGDKAKAAGSPRVAPATKANEIDPLSLPDDEFMKLRV